jgi:hypothetical protein
VSPASGTFTVTGGRADVPVTVTSGAAADVGVTFDLTEGGRPLPDLTLDVDVSSSP